MITERLTIPTGTPFSVIDLAAHCRVEGWGEDEITLHAQAAVAELEQYAQLALLTQTIRVTLDAWPRGHCLTLPIAPVIDPVSVTITVDGTAFHGFAVLTGLRPALRLTGAMPCGVIVIEYQAGFGDTAADIPRDLSLGIMDQTSASFDMRGAGDGKTNGMSPHMARIAARYRRVAL